MTADRRQVLKFMVWAAQQSPDSRTRQREYLKVAADYVNEGEAGEAVPLMMYLENDYLRRRLPVEMGQDEQLTKAVVVLVETFGADLGIYNNRSAGEA
jgi:hypothetical protein